jgi:hypothetical protein
MAEVKSSAPAASSSTVPAPAQNQEAKAEEDRKKLEERRAEAVKQLDEDDKKRHDANVEAGQKAAKVQPTPTQREADLAKLGLLDIDKKEPSGAGPDPHALQPPTPNKK